MLALNTVPVTLVSGPGLGKIISVIDVKGIYHFGTTPYAAGSIMAVGYGGQSVRVTGWMDADAPVSKVYLTDLTQVTSGDFNTTTLDGMPLLLVGSASGGDGDFVFDILYRIIDL